MKAWFFSLLATLLTSCAMTPSNLETFLRSSKKHGFEYQRSAGPDMHVIAFQGPGMKQAWNLMVGVWTPQSSGNGKHEVFSFVSIGTTLWKGKTEPSKELSALCMQMNAADNNAGSLSTVRQGDEWFVQYFVRVPMKYVSQDQIVFYVGYVGGFADSVSEKLKGMR